MTTVSVYVKEDVPDELKAAVASAVREVAHALRAVEGGTSPTRAFPVTVGDLQDATLGVDLGGDQLTPPALIQPLMTLSMLVFGAVMLACLISAEIEQRTVS